MKLELDHLVVGAATLAQGVAWCEATLGVVPTAGGTHPLMGTHNRVLGIATPRFPRAYLEIIAIDSAAPPPGRARWYDLDDERLQRRLRSGPSLIHWVARVADLDAACAAWRAAGLERGVALAASRGALHWRIAVRPDGARLAAGQLPTLIEWGDAHPCDTLGASGITLERVRLRDVPAALQDDLRHAVEIDGAPGPALEVHLATPLGARRLDLPNPTGA